MLLYPGTIFWYEYFSQGPPLVRLRTYFDVQVCDAAFVNEIERVENLPEKSNHVILKRHHVFVQNRLKITPRSAENSIRNTVKRVPLKYF